jgi:trigger factor
MQISTKKLPSSMVELTVTADAVALAPFRAEVLKGLSQEVKIDGYRPGHIPEDKLIERVGEATVQHEAANLAVKRLYAEAVKKEQILVVAPPEISLESLEPFKFVAKVAVLPEVELGDYQKIKLKPEEVKVTDEELKKLSEDILKRQAKVQKVTDRPAKSGDHVEIDFAGTTPDGVPLDNTSSKNHPLTLGEGKFIPGFEEAITGMQLGEEKEFEVNFPKDYHAKQLAGQPVKFKVKLNEINEIIAPEPTDELAAQVSGGKRTKWSEVENDMREYLEAQKKQQAQQKLEDSLVQELLKLTKVELPPVLIEEEGRYMLDDLKQRVTSGGMEWGKFLEQSGKTEESLAAENHAEAEKRVKVRLVINKLIELEKPAVTDAEYAEELARIQQNYPESEAKKIEEAYAPLSPNGQRLKHQLKVLKLLKELTEKFSA